MAKKVILEVKNLHKDYGKKEQVLQGVNFTFCEGDRIALLGLNGSGKTTMIETILGFKKYQKGEIVYQDGFRNFSQNVLAIFQIGKYPGMMRVKDLIWFCQNFYKNIITKAEIKKTIALLELEKLLDHKINKLSFGQKKKVEALVTLIVENQYYIIDEITAGVDINARINIVNFFAKKVKEKKKTAMIWITHDHQEIETLCNRVVLLSKKKKNIIFDGTIEEIKAKYQSIQNILKWYIKQELGREQFVF